MAVTLQASSLLDTRSTISFRPPALSTDMLMSSSMARFCSAPAAASFPFSVPVRTRSSRRETPPALTMTSRLSLSTARLHRVRAATSFISRFPFSRNANNGGMAPAEAMTARLSSQRLRFCRARAAASCRASSCTLSWCTSGRTQPTWTIRSLQRSLEAKLMSALVAAKRAPLLTLPSPPPCNVSASTSRAPWFISFTRLGLLSAMFSMVPNAASLLDSDPVRSRLMMAETPSRSATIFRLCSERHMFCSARAAPSRPALSPFCRRSTRISRPPIFWISSLFCCSLAELAIVRAAASIASGLPFWRRFKRALSPPTCAMASIGSGPVLSFSSMAAAASWALSLPFLRSWTRRATPPAEAMDILTSSSLEDSRRKAATAASLRLSDRSCSMPTSGSTAPASATRWQ
mmetsp:Transcript_18039/g.50456  ORF Transcript_18039/g.50456 Transcript_18039/m.50456 type:complete len:405 (+) Transcript_18039:1397-2611(+)